MGYFKAKLVEDEENELQFWHEPEPDYETENKVMDGEKFYLISALRPDSCNFATLKRRSTLKEAITDAKAIIEKRRAEGQTEMGFYILEASTYIGPVAAPIRVQTLKAKRPAKSRIKKKR